MKMPMQDSSLLKQIDLREDIQTLSTYFATFLPLQTAGG